jgi:MraZ protein
VFRGRYEHAIDGKGRVSLPARYREAMATEKQEILVVTKSDEPCLVAYTLQAFEEFEAKLDGRDAFSGSVRRIKRHIVGNAQECPIDGMGRVLVPTALREYAGIQKDVVFLGQVSFIEIWSKERWARAESQVLDRLPGDLQTLSELGA